jgi:uncharacterized membrane protein
VSGAALAVYHCDAEKGSELSETFKLMEQRLLAVIISPAMGATWVLGLWLVWQSGFWKSGWFHAKLLTVLILSGVLQPRRARWEASLRTAGDRVCAYDGGSDRES